MPGARRATPAAHVRTRRAPACSARPPLVGVAWLVAFGLGFSPADVDQRESVRILYVHVPVGVARLPRLHRHRRRVGRSTCSASATRSAGTASPAPAPRSACCSWASRSSPAMLWGRLTWGVFWEWDARLTTTAFLFVTYVGYLAVRRLGGTHEQRARRSAVLALLAVLEIPLVHWSVRLWRSLHQEATVLRPDGDVKMDGLMLFTLFVGIIAFTLLYVWLVIHRQRTMAAEDALDDAGLDLAIADRRAEATRR